MLTTYATNQILNALFGKTSSASLAPTAYLALSSTKPTIAGDNVTEPSGNGYARTLIGMYNQSATQKMGTPNNNAISNSAEVNFPKATGAWGTFGYVCLFNAATGGTLIAWMEITTPITVSTAGTIAHIDVGDLTFELTPEGNNG